MRSSGAVMWNAQNKTNPAAAHRKGTSLSVVVMWLVMWYAAWTTVNMWLKEMDSSRVSTNKKEALSHAQITFSTASFVERTLLMWCQFSKFLAELPCLERTPRCIVINSLQKATALNITDLVCILLHQYSSTAVPDAVKSNSS